MMRVTDPYIRERLHDLVGASETQTRHTVRPQPGMLVLFPSYFWHGTVPFKSDQPRLTVAFDAVPNR